MLLRGIVGDSTLGSVAAALLTAWASAVAHLLFLATKRESWVLRTFPSFPFFWSVRLQSSPCRDDLPCRHLTYSLLGSALSSLSKA